MISNGKYRNTHLSNKSKHWMRKTNHERVTWLFDVYDNHYPHSVYHGVVALMNDGYVDYDAMVTENMILFSHHVEPFFHSGQVNNSFLFFLMIVFVRLQQ